MARPALLAALVALAPALARADRCSDVLAALSSQLATGDAVCFWTPDLTTNGASTTPANNAPIGEVCVGGTCVPVPPGAFTPVTDRGVISPSAARRTPITRAVPGVQLEARVAGDATREARFLLRLPDDWNGRLVVAGASGTRSEFNGDFAWSDYVLQKGYAYASQNKGVLNLRIVSLKATPSTVGDPLACRLNPASQVWVHFYDDDAEKPFTEWQQRIVQAARIARDGVQASYGRFPRWTYAVGTSNGGYQVRRAIEEAPDLFDGGVDWEGTFVDGSADNLLGYLPPALKWFPAYVASGHDPSSPAARAIVAAGYPPDIVLSPTTTLWTSYWAQFWEVTACQWQKRLDPTYDTYGAGLGDYGYLARAATTDVAGNLEAFATTGKIKKPLVTVAGTMDGLLPVVHQARAYAAAVARSRKGNDEHRAPQYRYYEVQNGNHIETYVDTFPQLELLQPHAQKAFDLLVDHVERGAPLPPDQCVGKGGSISPTPGRPGQCAALFAP
ncbi:MAG TPA: 3-hydroxybutyrate oligomer hydrolase family protein [Anaeromyxobacteraceae bacterium]|nr:3-hydroxybutyrate oligomer hydrolase family protein [Anaeromyxobacteraceae bacterium]